MSRLFVGNLPFRSQREELRQFVEMTGLSVQSVEIVTDRDTGRSKGFGFIELEEGIDAAKAISILDGRVFGGRDIRVSMATPMRQFGGRD